MSSGDDKSTTKRHHVDESLMLKAMQQQFQRLDIMFGVIKDNGEARCNYSQFIPNTEGKSELCRNDANDGLNDDYEDAFNNDAQNSNFNMDRFMRGRRDQKGRFNRGEQNMTRWGDQQDRDLGSIKMKIPPLILVDIEIESVFDGNQDDSISTTSCDPLHTQGGPVTRARAKKMHEALNGLIEQIWVENNIQQANRSLDDYQGMINMIQVQEKLN
ncbi:hypothetical protein SLEP1_g12609 [Rubroshorea leprosula]|uniref:Uncharacterized protein n=1 Tax=Rubroshorea leprosula TaxID=152421 RepID=A0AAV5IL21_9ROSI|nr:hypothetical protein SLEP1_g12609 [Rubroshorea leprosula]